MFCPAYHCRMNDTVDYRELRCQYEIIRARLDVYAYFRKAFVDEVYENIGQILSLTKVKLTMIGAEPGKKQKQELDDAGRLLGSVIRDLRRICEWLEPDQLIRSMPGFNLTIQHVIRQAFPDVAYQAYWPDTALKNVSDGKMLILFSLMLEMLRLFETNEDRMLTSIDANYAAGAIELVIHYTGESIKGRTKKETCQSIFMIAERIRLFDGSLQLRNRKEKKSIRLIMPLE